MPNRHHHKLSQYFGNVKYVFNFNLIAWDNQKLMSKECNIRKLFCMVFTPLQGWFYIVIIHKYVTIQWQFKFHQRNIGFLCRSYNPSQGIIIDGYLRRRAVHMPWVQMFGKHHQEWQQKMLVLLFHNCCNFIPAYIFHDALWSFKPWIELKSAYIVCSNNIKGHNKSQKKLQHINHFKHHFAIQNFQLCVKLSTH